MSNRKRRIEWMTAGLCEPPYKGAGGKRVQWLKVTTGETRGGPYSDVRLRFERRGPTWQCTGLYLTSANELAPTDIAERFPLTALVDWASESIATITGTKPPRVTELRRVGRGGSSDEFYRQVAKKVIWAMGQPEHRRNYVQWLRQQRDLWTEAQLERAQRLEAEGSGDAVEALAATPYETVKTWLRTARTTIDPTTGKPFLPPARLPATRKERHEDTD